MGTIDAHLIAIDAKSGQLVWNTKVGDSAQMYAITMAPNVIKDKVIVGTAGGDMGIRGVHRGVRREDGQGSLALLHDPRRPASPAARRGPATRGARAAWPCGTRAPTTARRTWCSGAPAIRGRTGTAGTRLGDNLYSDSVVALDVDTGKLKWHYQFTPHDELDYDSTQVPVLADIDWRGTPRKVMLWANRNGVMYVLDRVTGEFLSGKPYVEEQLDGRLRREGPAAARGRHGRDEGAEAVPSARARRDQLGADVVQPAHRPVLRRALGELRHRRVGRRSSRSPSA